jgi:hypothetical protein
MDERQQPEDDGEPTLEGCFAPDGTDLTLIQWFLERTPAERLQTAQSMVDFVAGARCTADADLLSLIRALHDHAVDFVVVGALAAVLEGAPIDPIDIQVVYRANVANLERLLAALSELGATYRDPTGRAIRPDLNRLATNGTNLLQTRIGVLDAMREIAPGWRFGDLLERSHPLRICGMDLRVLNLASQIESSEAVARSKDSALTFVLRDAMKMRERYGSPA